MGGNTRVRKFDKKFEEATAQGQAILAASPAAEKVFYNSESGRLVIELKNGVTALVPANLIQIFENASEKQISDVETAVGGLYLRWNSLDEDLFVPNLLQGVFGTHKWMGNLRQHLSMIGAKGGAAKSEAKSKSARENGKKGGRPGKKQIA